MANGSYQNVLVPYGAWSNTAQYKAQTVYGGVASTPLYLGCPLVTNAGHVYFATGFKTDGTALQPTLGTAPASDPAWQELI